MSGITELTEQGQKQFLDAVREGQQAAFDFAEKLLAAQRELARKLIDAASPTKES